MKPPRLSLSLGLILTACFYARASGQNLPLQELETRLRESTPLSKRQQFDDIQAATRYWYESRNPVNISAMDEALGRVLPLALQIAPKVKDFTTWEEAQLAKPYHYAGGILLAKAYTLLYYGRVKEARESMKLLEESLPYSMVLFSDRSVIWARQALRYHQHAVALYAGMVTHTLDKFSFPEERDEFDEPQQVKAVADQVILRLREGNMPFVDHLVSAFRKQKLRSTAGKWMEDLIFDSMEPIEAEAHSEAAWNEMRDSIKRWQLAYPKSEDAKVAEAAFLINHSTFQWSKGKPYSAYRQDVETALDILKAHPMKSTSWFTLNTRALIRAGRPIDEVMLCARENLIQFPDHAQPLTEACVLLARGDDESKQTCGQFLQVLCQQPNKENPARVLNVLSRLNVLDDVKQRLDLDDVDEVVRATGEQWSQSLSLRNEFAQLSMDLGLRDTAHLMLSGIEDHWSHQVWANKTDVLRQVISRTPKNKGTITPAAAAVKFQAWLPPTQEK